MVEGGVEDAPLGPGSAADVDPRELSVPSGRGGVAHGIEVPAVLFGTEVGRRVGDTGVRETDLHGDRRRPVGRRREGCVDAGRSTGALSAAGRECGSLPGSLGLERSVELGGEMGIVRSHRVAEPPGDRRPREGSVTCDRELPAGETPLTRSGVDEDRGTHARREREATDPGPVGDGELNPHPVGEGDGVVAGRGRLRVVGERGFEVTGIGVRRLRDRPGKRQDREVLEGGTARSRQVGEAEAVDGVKCVEVPAGHRLCERCARGIGTPLDHPERDIGARKGADRPDLPLADPGADEGIDRRRRVAAADGCGGRRSRSRGASRRGEQEREQQGQRTAWCPQPWREHADPQTAAPSSRHEP